MTVSRAATPLLPRLPRHAEPRLPYRWLTARGAGWLLLGFLVLLALGTASAWVLTDATPVTADAGPPQDAAEQGLSPRVEALDPADSGIDARVAVGLVERRPDWLLGLATLTSHLGKIWVVVPVVVVVGAVAWRRTGRGSVFWIPGLAMGGGLALSVAVKFIVFRPRPPAEVSLIEAFGPSYPSGHVIRAVAVYGALAWLAAAMTSSRRRQALAWATATALVVVVGSARVVEGAHWLTDVVASLLLGAGWLVVVLAASGLLGRRGAQGGRHEPAGAGTTEATEALPVVTPAVPLRRAVVGLTSGLVGLITLGCALAVVGSVVAPDLAVTGIDADVTAFLADRRSAWLTTVNLSASRLGDLLVVGALVVVLGVAVGVRSGRWRLLWVPGLAGAGGLIISVVVKAFTDRARPPLTTALVDAHGLAFPSGHAIRAAAVYGALAWLVAAGTHRRAVRLLTWTGAVALVVGVGFARIYLGAHWLTDVLAGYVLGAAWLGLVLVLTTVRPPPEDTRPRGVRGRAAIATLASLLVLAGCAGQQPAGDAPPRVVPEAPAAPPDDPEPGGHPPPEGELAVHFIDVGQGDATLLVTEDTTVLVDAGRHTATDVVDYLERAAVTAIDVVAITHPHADHLGQFDLVMERFDVAEVWWSPTTHTTQTFDRALDALEASEAAYEEPGAGDATEVGALRFDFANPTADAQPGDLHDSSLAFRVTYGDVAFLFTGDAEGPTEQRMVDTRAGALAADVYQVGHHGSSTSTSESFLAAVSPRLAVYSAGQDSQYGHPHDEVVDRLTGAGVTLYGTPEHGTVVVTTDGEDLWVQTATGAPPIGDRGDRP